MELRLLGPVEASVGGRPVPLGGTKPKTLLAALLIDHGRVVPATRLVDAIWGAEPPDTSRAVMQTYVSMLRQALARAGATELIVTRSPGYLLQVQPGMLDRDIFERLFSEGREAAAEGRHRDAVELLREASAQWRGGALGGIDSELLSGEAARLDEMRLAAIEERINAELKLGRLKTACLELTELVWRHPYRERLRAQLMLALCGLGRRSDALAVYREGREALVDELGIEPGPDLRAVQDMVLRHEVARVDATHTRPGLSAIAGPNGTDEAPVSIGDDDRSVGRTPAQLPPVPADFTGRAAELANLVSALRRDPGVGTVPVQAIVGAAGTGKSTLAAWVAHEVASRYPDGQLYADLGGMSGQPADPRDLLGRFLVALGEEPGGLPETQEERTERYRTLVAGRRVLVLLDDASSESQIRPLLPGAYSCSVLVTSRRRLGGLAGACLTELDVLGTEEGRELLSRIVGADRVSAEDDAARRIVRRCGGLPLAIRVAGARLVHRQRWPLGLMADRLADEGRRLDELSVGDQEVRSSIGLSYRALDPQARAVLRVLGVLNLPEFPSWVVAAALRLSGLAGEQIVERLVDAQLVDFAQIDRLGRLWYRFNDLVRIYARERAEIEDHPDLLRDVVSRVTGGWLWILDQIGSAGPSGSVVLSGSAGPSGSVVLSGPAGPSGSLVLPGPLPDELAELALTQPAIWCHVEKELLVRTVRVAAECGLDEIARTLAAALTVLGPELPDRIESGPGTPLLARSAPGGGRRGEVVGSSGPGRVPWAQNRYAESRAGRAVVPDTAAGPGGDGRSSGGGHPERCERPVGAGSREVPEERWSDCHRGVGLEPRTWAMYRRIRGDPRNWTPSGLLSAAARSFVPQFCSPFKGSSSVVGENLQPPGGPFRTCEGSGGVAGRGVVASDSAGPG